MESLECLEGLECLKGFTPPVPLTHQAIDNEICMAWRLRKVWRVWRYPFSKTPFPNFNKRYDVFILEGWEGLEGLGGLRTTLF